MAIALSNKFNSAYIQRVIFCIDSFLGYLLINNSSNKILTSLSLIDFIITVEIFNKFLSLGSII